MDSGKIVDIPTIKKPIVLVGMMGCGKSTVGRSLARYMTCSFYDCDDLIVKDQGKDIKQIFADGGESYFRKLEQEKMQDLLDGGFCVISTGGGAVTVPKILEMISAKGISIWLRSDVEKILKRLNNDNSRPLLQCDNPRKKLEELLSARERLYASADIHVGNTSNNINNTVHTIIQELQNKNAN